MQALRRLTHRADVSSGALRETGITAAPRRLAGKMFWPRPTLLRPLLTLSNIMLWSSAAVVLFLAANYMQSMIAGPKVAMIVMAVVAAGTILASILGLMFSTRRTYRGRMLPVNVLLSYLWLGTAIMAHMRRQATCKEPSFKYACQRMKAVQAFSTIAFAFTLVNIALEALLYGWHLIPPVPDVVPPVGGAPVAPVEPLINNKPALPAAGVSAPAVPPPML